jgi:predicted AAA+ superfamily ATPase
MQQLRDWKDRHIIKVVTGMRRSGKSTLLEMLADEIRQSTDKSQVQLYNFEDPDMLSIGGYKAVYDYIKVRLVDDKMNYIFLDEVQNIEQFERLVDGLYIKKNVDLYVTGSNACILSSELATLLTGRYIEINILPFSFGEYNDFILNYKNLSAGEILRNMKERKSSPNSQNFTKNELFGNFIYGGGIPQVIDFAQTSISQADDLLKSILTTIIEKDIFKRRDVYNKSNFQKIVDFIFDSVGSYISPNSISKTLKTDGYIVDTKTIAGYLYDLSSAYLLYKAPRYDVKGKKLLQTLDKYYLADTGFRKMRLGKKSGEDRGHLLENAVYLELRRRNSEVYVGKLRDKEIDFVAIDGKGYVSYYQVAYSVLDEQTLERELAPLRAIRDSNPKYLISADWDTDPVYDGIRKVNAISWLLNN